VNRLSWASLGGDTHGPIQVRELNQGTLNRHSHEFFEFVYVEEGFCLHFSDNDTELLLGGDLLVITPGMEHNYWCKQNITIVNILFMPELFLDLLEEVKNLPGTADIIEERLKKPLIYHLNLQDREEMWRIIAALRQAGEAYPSGGAGRSGLLLADMLILLSRQLNTRFAGVETKTPYLVYALKAVERIEGHYAEELYIGKIAESLGIGPDHLTRQFRQITGITPTEYVRRRRFAQALELLRKQRSISSVYAETGFRSINYFSREFKALFNMTPSEFRRQARSTAPGSGR
jgi:AraC-like DNA-binding protein